MTINEMRIEVCKRANKQIRQGMNRARAFKWAWAIVKEEANKIKAIDLKVGDVVRKEFGDDGNFVTCTVLDVKINGNWVDTTVRYNDGREFTMCARKNDTFEKVA